MRNGKETNTVGHDANESQFISYLYSELFPWKGAGGPEPVPPDLQ